MSKEMSNMALACLGKQKEIETLESLALKDLEETYRVISEEQKQTGGTVLHRVKIPSGGGKAFDILTGDEDEDTSVSTFAGVIVYHHKCNALFDEDTTGNTPPVCSSVDGEQGWNSVTGETRSCAGCPQNAYGTSKKGRGKACKNMHKLYIMVPGSSIPFVLCLPPTSLKSLQNYFLKTLAARRLRPFEVLTEFSVLVAQNSDGIKYSTVKFKLLGKLDDSDLQAAQFFATGLQLAAGVSAEDYNREPVKPSIDVEADATDFPEDDFPFPEDT